MDLDNRKEHYIARRAYKNGESSLYNLLSNGASGAEQFLSFTADTAQFFKEMAMVACVPAATIAAAAAARALHANGLAGLPTLFHAAKTLYGMPIAEVFFWSVWGEIGSDVGAYYCGKAASNWLRRAQGLQKQFYGIRYKWRPIFSFNKLPAVINSSMDRLGL